MAANNVSPSIALRGHGYLVVLWEAMIADSTGLKFEAPSGYYLDSVQAFGTFDTSGTVTVEGSNVPGGAGTYVTLPRDAQATPDGMVFSAAAIYPVFAPALFVRPRTTANGAGAAVDLDVYAFYRQRA